MGPESMDGIISLSPMGCLLSLLSSTGSGTPKRLAFPPFSQGRVASPREMI
jgi:hypothetical protein